MSDTKNKKNDNAEAKNAFQSVSEYVTKNKFEAASLVTSLGLGGLMMTTSLVSPLFASGIGAAAMLAASITLLIKNGETTLDNVLAMSKKTGISTLALGLIIGSLNTVPEIMVSVGSVVRGAMELGIGNVIGSNIAHSLLILGATAAVAGISKAKDLSWKFNTYMMAGTAALFGAQLIMEEFSPVLGGGMLLMGVVYLTKRIQDAKKGHAHDHGHGHGCDDDEIGTCLFHDHDDDEKEILVAKRPKWLNTALAGGGILGLMAAADIIVQSGKSLVTHFNLSSIGLENFDLTQAAVGAVIVAIGTSLPELLINIKAIRKNHSDLAIGNILGCSIINTLFAGGIISMTGITVPEIFNPSTSSGLLHIGAFMGSAGILTAMLLATKGAVSRTQGALALLAYGGYVLGSLILNDGKLPTSHDHAAVTNHTTLKNENIRQASVYSGDGIVQAQRAGFVHFDRPAPAIAPAAP